MASVTKRLFGVTKDGEPVTEYTMKNAEGMTVRVLDYGATVRSVLVPDREGRPVDVVLGYDDLTGYESGNCYFGACVGRVANRIAGARFSLNGTEYRLEPNDGENHLHGTFSRRVFKRIDASDAAGETTRKPACAGSPQEPEDAEAAFLLLRYTSPNGEEGYPGTLSVEVTYTLTAESALRIDYTAETDEPTVVNLTNHSYFNLNGAGDVLGHTLRIDADRFAEIGEGLIPTGRLLPVSGTPFDFREPEPIGRGIASLSGPFCETNETAAEERHLYRAQLRLAGGYDHSYALNGEAGRLRPFAEAAGDRSGIRLKAFTTEPAVQLYTGNFVDCDTASGAEAGGALPGPHKNGVRYPKHAGFCLEAQHHPDAVHRREFGTVVLRPGETYRQTTIYRFLKPAE